LLGLTIGEALSRAAETWPERDAVVARHQNARLNWRELRDRADATAAGLLALGLEPGDRVGIWSPNCIEWVVTQLATARAGFVLVNINPAYRVSELAYALTKVRCSALITAGSFKSSNYVAMVCELAPELRSCSPGTLGSPRLPDLRHVICLSPREESGIIDFDSVRASPGANTTHDSTRFRRRSSSTTRSTFSLRAVRPGSRRERR
jgi:fatty-acyl-CoA synthase